MEQVLNGIERERQQHYWRNISLPDWRQIFTELMNTGQTFTVYLRYMQKDTLAKIPNVKVSEVFDDHVKSLGMLISFIYQYHGNSLSISYADVIYNQALIALESNSICV
jgi:hypothetical protein